MDSMVITKERLVQHTTGRSSSGISRKERNDEYTAFDSELGVDVESNQQGTQPSPLQQPQQRPPFRSIHSMPIYFQEDWKIGIGGGLWSTGLVMSEYFNTASAIQNFDNRQRLLLSQQNNDNNNNKNNNKNNNNSSSNTVVEPGLSILELGSGNGYLAVCLAAAITSSSISSSSSSTLPSPTDTLPNESSSSSSSPIRRPLKIPVRNLVITDVLDHLPMIQTTLQQNPQTMTGIHNVSIQEHQWGIFTTSTHPPATATTTTTTSTESPTVSSLSQTTTTTATSSSGCCRISRNPSDSGYIPLDGTTKFDFIIGSDVAYQESLYQPLIRSLRQLSHSTTIILLGVTMADTTPLFFHQLDAAHFQWQKLADHLIDAQFRGTTFGLFAIQQQQQKS